MLKMNDIVVVNGNCDLMLDRGASSFIGKRCVILQQNENGSFLVGLESSIKEVYTFERYNLDLAM